MAVTAIAGIASALGAAAAQIGAAGFFATLFSAAGATAFAIGAGLSMVSRALAPKPNIGAQMRGITQTSREPAGSRKIVYGQMRVGGQVVFISNSGDDNKYLHLAIAFASHEIESYEEIWFNDKKIWQNGSFLSGWDTYVTVDLKYGTAGQAESDDLVNASTLWTSDHKLSGIAYIAFRLEWDADKFPQGVPNITAVLKGKKVYDPRTATTGWSQNPALCLRDYMLDDKYGLGEVTANIDSTAINAAANLCEEQVGVSSGAVAATSINSGTTYEIVTLGTTDFTAIGASANTVGVQFTATGAGTGTGTATSTFQDRYTCNGVIDTANQIKANIEQILSAMGGMLTYSGGKYFFDGAEYKTPTVTFDETDCIADIQTQTKQSRRGVYNGVKGIFVSEEKNYKVLDYPAQISSTYATEDGDPLYLDMPLPFVTNNTQAQRLAKIALLQSRQQVVINMTVNLKGLQIKVGDTIYVTNERIGYSSKVFQVIDYSLAIAGGGSLAVNLVCIETAAAIYDWNTSDEEDFLAGGELDLYDGRTVNNVTNLTSSEIGLRGPDGRVKSAVQLTWTALNDAFVEFYTIRYNVNGTTDYFEVQTRQNRALIEGLDLANNYDFLVQAQNLIGVKSTGTSITNLALNGDTTAPSAPTSVTLTAGINQITCEWTNPTDIDLAFVEVHVTTTSATPAVGASPTAKISGEEYIAVGLSTDTRFFHLRAVDFSGNKSGYTAAVSTTSSKVTESDLDPTIVTGIDVVSTLPASGYEGEVVYLTGDEKLYRYNGTSWTVAVDGDDIIANTITGGKIQAGAIGTSLLTVGAIGGTTVTATKIYHGGGTFNSAGTPFYVDDGGDFSLKDKLSFDSSTSTLTVDGTVRADILDVVDATVVGNFVSNNIADGIVFGESLNTHAIAEIESRLFDVTTHYNHKSGTTFVASNGLNTNTTASVNHNLSEEVRFEFIFNAAWDSWDVQYSFATNDDKATLKFEHKKSTASTWTTVYTTTITAIKTDTDEGHVFTVNAREFYVLTSLATGTYQFRATLQSQTTGVNYWSLAEPEPESFTFSVYELATKALELSSSLTCQDAFLSGYLDADGLIDGAMFRVAGDTVIDTSKQLQVGSSTADHNITGNCLLGDSLDVRINSSTGTSIFEGNSTDYVLRNNVGTSVTLQLGGSATRYTWNTARFSGASDNAYDLGSSGVRWRDAYVAGGVTTTSDDRLKQQVRNISDAESRVAVAAKGLLKAYKYNDAVESKGADARWHIGIIAQDLKAAFEAEGLDAHEYGMFMWNEWWEADVWVEEADHPDGGYTELRTWDVEADAPDNAVRKDQYAIRYGELLAFIIASI